VCVFCNVRVFDDDDMYGMTVSRQRYET
jgi:hypothetical protein